MPADLRCVSLIAVFTIPLAFVVMYPANSSNRCAEGIVRPSLRLTVGRTTLRIDRDHASLTTMSPDIDHQQPLGG